MAVKKAEYFKFNQDGNVWDLYYFKTSADLIAETDTKKVLTSSERDKISDFLTTFNTTDKLVRLDNGKILKGLIPDLPYLPANGGTVNGDLEVTGLAEFRGNTIFDDVFINGIIKSDSNLITFDELDYIDFGGTPLTNIGAPTTGTDAANREYVDNKVSSGFTTKEPVKSASIGNIDITEVLNALDGFTLSANDRVLLKNQTTASQNGIYKLDSSKIPVKVDDDSAIGSAVFVENGNSNNDYIYHCSTENTWVAFSKPDTVKDGAGLTKSGTTLSIANGGVTNDMLAGNINEAKIKSFTFNDDAGSWSHMPSASSTEIGLNEGFNILATAINRLRGAGSYKADNNQTIAGAYTRAATAQTAADDAMAAIPKITSGTSNPATAGAKNGDLYFKEMS